MKRLFRAFTAAGLAVAFAALSPASSRADMILGITFVSDALLPQNPLNSGNQLISIDTTTGVGTLVGALGVDASPFGLATAGNRLFTFDSEADVIRQINTATGGIQATFNIGVGNLLGQGGLAFQNNNVGFLTSALNPTTLEPENNLFRFDISTGTSTRLGSTPSTIEALAFDNAGTLFGLGKLDGNLFRIDTMTGATTLVGNTGVDVGSPIGGLTFGPGGMLFATLDDKLFTLDRTTGRATPVGSSDPLDDTGFSSISGLATIQAVPEPSTVAMAITGVVACGLFARRRTGARSSS